MGFQVSKSSILNISKKKLHFISLLMIVLYISEYTPVVGMETLKGKANIEIFDSKEGLKHSVAEHITNLSNKSAGTSVNTFTIVLSDDIGIISSLRLLLEEPFANSIDWSKWYVFWVDERVVPKSSNYSNYKIANDVFLSKTKIPSENIISINDKLSTEEASIDYENRLKELVRRNVIAASPTTGFPCFDVILLGLGYNGHTASLFPNHPQLYENKKWVTYIEDSPKPPPQRITMTYPVINSASNVAFVVTGRDKAQIVRASLKGDQTKYMIPAKGVSPRGQLKWILYKEAATLL